MRFYAFITGLLMLISVSFCACADMKLGEPVKVPTPEGKFTMPSFSPDGNTLAFARQNFSGLYVLDWQGNCSTISEAPLSGWRYSWSGDGQNIAYRIRYGDTSALAGMLNNQDGTAQEQITDWKNDLYPPKYGKDGITFKDGDDILTVDEKGHLKGVKSLSNGMGIVSRIAGLSAALFANGLTGTSISAFAALIPVSYGKVHSKDILTSPENELLVVDENGDVKKLIDSKDESGFVSPQVSPNEDTVAAPTLSGHLYLASLSDGNSIDLGTGQNPSWSYDGKYLVYEVATEDGHNITGSDIWIASKDGKWKKQLTCTPDIERYPSLSPNGKLITYEIDGNIYYAPIEE